MGNKVREQKQKQFATGWVNYYAMADMKNLMQETDEWMRRKIRAVYWKQWKKVRTRYKMLQGLHLPDWQVHKLANSRKRYLEHSASAVHGLTKQIIVRLGYVSMSDYYQSLKTIESPCTERYARWCGRSVCSTNERPPTRIK